MTDKCPLCGCEYPLHLAGGIGCILNQRAKLTTALLAAKARIAELEGHNAALAYELRRLSDTCCEPDVESIDRVLAEAAEAAKEAK